VAFGRVFVFFTCVVALDTTLWLISLVCVCVCFKLVTSWWAWELVPSKAGMGPVEIPGTEGRFHGNHVSGIQPCKWSATNTVTLKELQGRNLSYLIPTMNCFQWEMGRAGWWINKIGNQSSDLQSLTEQANCKYGDQSSDPSKVVIHKDHQSRQLEIWGLELTCKHMARRALTVTP